ncbi:MAG TPA: tRNA lysidine(34) synthetase TilS [Ruminococcus sp.]|nr:tRNA lysidine(34) synthetase TilS [Ruminococcus sp.]
MNNLVLAAIEKYNMISTGDRVVVALSGGADSVSLLDALCSLKEKYNLTIYAAHLNHNLRGEEAERDENFCKILCKNYEVELFIKSIDIHTLANEQKISEELCGRNERYKFFDELSVRLNAKIATAHSASDNAETLIYNIARGSSVRGLSAIPPKRGRIIRPLIEVSRAQIEEYCKQKGLAFVTDSTNLTDDYTRNRIRHSVMGTLRDINPQLEQSVSQLSESAREVTDYLNKQAQAALDKCKTQFGFSCKMLLQLDTAVLKHSLVLLCERTAKLTPEHRHIELMIKILNNGGAVNLSSKFIAVSKQGIFRIISVNDNEEFKPVSVSENFSINYNGKIYSITKQNSNKENKNSVSIDSIDKGAVFRTRKEGDKFTYPQRKVTKPLRKVLNEMKIPSEQRDNLLVLAIYNTILWCENIGVSEDGKNDSDKELNIKIESEV